MGKRKRIYGTWADAEIAAQAHQKSETVLLMALRDLVSGNVKWIEGEQPRKIGLSRLADAHGGIVILAERQFVGARYLDEWLSEVQRTEAPKGRDYMPEYKAWIDIRRLAAAAKTAQTEAQDKAAAELKGCAGGPIPPEVDQSVRTY